MVFDVPPHNNREIPLYFLRKMYVEFMLGKHVNYFDMMEFQGVGKGDASKISQCHTMEMSITKYLQLAGRFLGQMSRMHMV